MRRDPDGRFGHIALAARARRRHCFCVCWTCYEEEVPEEEEEETVVIYGRHMEQKQILSEKWADWTRRRE